MSDDELEDWEYTDQNSPEFEIPAYQVLNLEEGVASRLEGFLRNPYCTTP